MYRDSKASLALNESSNTSVSISLEVCYNKYAIETSTQHTKQLSHTLTLRTA